MCVVCECRLEEAMLDVQPDEAMAMARKQRITKVGPWATGLELYNIIGICGRGRV